MTSLQTAAAFTQNDLVKYPFLKETAEYVKLLNLQIEDLTSPSMQPILKRAEERVNQTILDRTVIRNPKNLAIEISSFPVALLLVIGTENSLIKKRFALSEAKQASNDLANESLAKIVKIAQDFDWKIAVTSKENFELPFDFVLHFSDYLRNTAHLRDKKWKLTNSILSKGNVFLNKKDVARLLQEEIRRVIEKRLEAKAPKFPSEIDSIIDGIKKLASEKIGQTEVDMPKIVVQTAFPPCVNALYEAASKSHHLSHIERFTLTTFLINIGMPTDKVNELFKSFSDYNERLTRYQIEHLAGERGSGTRYNPPQCSVLQTHGVCKNRDDLCRKIYHPLKYYLLKQKPA